MKYWYIVLLMFVVLILSPTLAQENESLNKINVSNSTVDNTMKIFGKPTVLTLSSSQDSAYEGEKITFYGYLKDKDGNPVANKKIDVYDDDGWFGDDLLCSGYTGYDGYFECFWTVKKDDEDSPNQIEAYAKFKGDIWGGYEGSESSIISITILSSKVTVNFRVHNVPGFNLPGKGGTIRVEIWSGSTKVTQQSKSFSGGESYLSFSFSLDGNKQYRFRVFQKPSLSGAYEEYWGWMDVNVGSSSITKDFYRHLPYVYSVPTHGKKTLGWSVNPTINLKNPSSTNYNSYARLIIDRNKASPYDYDKSSSSSYISASSIKTYTLSTFKPPYTGTYYAYGIAYTYTDLGWKITDQVYWLQSPYITIVSKPDLTITYIDASSSAKPGDSIQVTYTVKNQGGSNAGSFVVKVYLSTQQYGTTTYLNCYKSHYGLSVGSTTSGKLYCKIPTSIKPGKYYITVFADANNQVSESNENNNIGSKAINIENVDDWNVLKSIVSEYSILYGGYYEHYLNESWWQEKMQQWSQEYFEEVSQSVILSPSEEIGTTVLNSIIPNLGNVFGAYSLANSIIKIGEGFIGIFKSLEVTYLCIGINPYPDNYNEKVRDYLNKLVDNGAKIKADITQNNKDALINDLKERKVLIENLYSILPDYDSASYQALQSISWISSLLWPNYYANYLAHKDMKIMLGSLYLQLQLDYLITTHYLSKLTGVGSAKKLNYVINKPIQPTRFDPSFDISGYLGVLRDAKETTNYRIVLSSEDLSGLENPKLIIYVGYIGDNVEMYVKYGTKPTESNYDYKGSKIEIANPNPGIYYILIKGNNSIYELESYLKYNEQWWGILYDKKSVDIYYEGIQTVEYPKPKIKSVEISKSEISIDDYVDVTIRVTNNGGTSSWQSIALSSPNITKTNSVTVLETNLDYFKKYEIGFEAGASYGMSKVKLKYPLFEGGKSNWPKGWEGYVKLRIKPEKTGDLILQVKSVAKGQGVYTSDPALLETTNVDQQNEFVKTYIVYVVPSQPQPKIKLSASHISFGEVQVGQDSTKTITIYNDGESTLTVTEIKRTSGSGEFSYVPFSLPDTTPPFDVPSGNSREIAFEFKPTSAGYKSATFVICSNDPNNPEVSINVDGTGIDQIVSVSIHPKSWSANVSEEMQFTLTANYQSGITEDVTSQAIWSSSNTGVVQHLGGGKFRAVGVGTATITGTYNGMSDTASVTVSEAEVKKPPVASFTFYPTSPTVGQTITFDASESYDPDGGSIVSYQWNFGDGTTAVGKVVNHMYNKTGTYKVTLTVIDDDGMEASMTKDIVVSDALVGLSIEPDGGTWNVGDLIEFKAIANYASGKKKDVTTEASWYVNNTSVLEPAECTGCYIAKSPGVALVTAVYDYVSASAIVKVTVPALEILYPNDRFSISVPPKSPITINFLIRNLGSKLIEFSQGDVNNRIDLEIEWDNQGVVQGVILWSTSYEGLKLSPGDVCEKTVSWIPKKEGIYTIRLVHWIKTGERHYNIGSFGKAEVMGCIHIESKPPIANFTYYPENPVINQTITFNASLSYDPYGTIIKYEWDFGDGSKAEGKVVTHTYSQAGSYIVTLTVTDDDGATNTTSKVVTVGEDWNPWNDSDSDGGEKITTAELQEAIHCWLNDEPAPKTGAEITTERLQVVIHLWLQE